jgi:regulation of enolase protein 1 (concanavalin A-like superfamily)
MALLRYLLIVVALPVSLSAQTGSLGVFTHSGDVGDPAIAGSTVYDPVAREYRITGAGANMWATDDQFQYVWREITGNFTATATLRFLGDGAPHRKAGIVVRQSLDADATYADVVVHGDGMPALQWRSRKGEDTNTFNLPFDGPGTFTVKLARTGIRVYMYVGKDGAEPQEVVHTEVSFQGPVLVGLGVCSHDAATSDTAVFTNVSVQAPGSGA